MQNHPTILGQMLQLLPRYESDKVVLETGTERHPRHPKESYSASFTKSGTVESV